MSTGVFSNVKKFQARLIDLFEEGRRRFEFRRDLNPHLARDIFVGSTDHIVKRRPLKDMCYSYPSGRVVQL